MRTDRSRLGKERFKKGRKKSVASTSSGSVSQLSVRSYEAADEQAVLDLIDADRLPGQPSTSAPMLAEALAGRSPVDGSRWADLDGLVTEVIHDGVRVLGVVSYAVRPSDEVGLVLWLHCLEEEPALAQALIVRALDRHGSRPVYAFEFASALAHEVRGLPARNRPGTRRALERSGFTARDRWRYFHRLLPTAPLGVLSYPVAEMSECADLLDDDRVARLGGLLVGQPAARVVEDDDVTA
ncbi:hypothetical protein AB0D38_33625, partial [Streptomyces sp. NPDC048279]|uniref:hypothetical protein n=1 Tax=Streptomyces sp. NPDC048279 TaxID=3154714 RepID=UPI00341A6140